MIQAMLKCMQELIRATFYRNTGWDKTVADISLPAQEALVAFPDLAYQYELLKALAATSTPFTFAGRARPASAASNLLERSSLLVYRVNRHN
jgi:hypothetical protein